MSDYPLRVADLEVVATGLRFPEGPVALSNGDILLVEIGGRALTRVTLGGDTEVVAALEGGPNGAAMGPGDWCYICNSGGWRHAEFAPGLLRTVGQSETPGWIERVSLTSGRIERLIEAVDGAPLQAPNDLVFDRQGGFYFTDHGKRRPGLQGLGGVFYASADGAHVVPVVKDMLTPNGVGLSPDGATLYVAETATRALWAFDLAGPGVIKPTSFPPASNGGRLVAGFSGYHRLDSLAVDARGHIAVASLIDGGVLDVSADGADVQFVPTGDVFTTNVCFGGADGRDAFVTLSASGRLARFRWPVPGAPLAYGASA